MRSLELLRKKIPEIEEKLKYSFQKKELLVLAFIHKSYVNENKELSHNERMEFLGDSILNLLISEYLYLNFPELPEGPLSYLRSRLIDSSSCSTYLESLKLGEFVLVGRGEKLNPARGRASILADLFEALIGALYLDGGLSIPKQLLFDLLLPEVTELLKEPKRNWKAELQEYSQKWYQTTPVYKVLEETGPDHEKTFHVSAWIEEKEIGRGRGPSKKEAEQAAAEKGLSFIKLLS